MIFVQDPLRRRPRSSNHKRAAIVSVIAAQLVLAIALVGLFAYRTYTPGPDPDLGKLVHLLILASGPINWLGLHTFPVFCLISTVVCGCLAAAAIRVTSYLLVLAFVLLWWASGISGLIYAA